MNSIPTVTKNLLIINVLCFFGGVVAMKYGINLNDLLGLHFFMASDFNPAQLITYMFMHGGFQHIFFNMFALWMFGRTLEQVWGPKRFLFYYMVCGIGAGLVQELVQYIQYVTELSQYDSVNTGIAVIPMAEYLNLMTTVGASGAIYGILLAFGMLFPNSQMFVFPIPFPVKAKYFVMGYAALEIFLGLGASTDGVAHFAHLGGMIFGFILIMYWRKRIIMGSFITDLKNSFNKGNIYIQFIYINVGVFIVTSLLGILWMLFNRNGAFVLQYLELPAWTLQFVKQPWSLLTYMFMHAGILHLLFNMLWLYWFGQMFLSLFSAKHFRGLYLLGGICGGLLYMIAYNVFPYFSDSLYYSYLLGASASVLAIVVATAVRAPEYRVNFMFIGTVRLKYVALFMVVTDLLFMTSGNAGGHIAHLGGALAGWWFASGLSRGHDATSWINRCLDCFSEGLSFRRQSKKTKMKVHYGDKAKDYDYNARKKQQSEEIDRILDKLKKSGYNSLTTEEKKSLFDASKK